MTRPNASAQNRFMEILRDHDALIHKVCFMYADDREHFQDLRQEVLANIWSGLDSYAERSKISTWVYRIAINTCITFFRRHGKHTSVERLEDTPVSDIADENDDRTSRLRFMYRLIGRLDKLDKAIVMLWLDEHSYDEISSITGLTRANVASRLHRIRQRLAASASDY